MNIKKTLADAQPGGRVRLGDALLPCPFCGNGAEFVPYKDNGLTLKCKSMGCIQRHQRTLRYGIEWLRASMTEHWNARALSAQPSPGGQGDKRAINKIARGLLADQMVGHAKHVFTVVGDDEIGVTCGEAVRAIETALAARQPVAAAVKDSLTVGGGHDLHQHLLDMLGAKSHEDAGRIIGQLHAQAVDLGPDRFRDPDHLAEWLGSLVDGSEQEEWDAAQAAMIGVRAFQQHPAVIERLREAVEGECDGLAITTEQAAAIFDHVLEPAPLIDGKAVGK